MRPRQAVPWCLRREPVMLQPCNLQCTYKVSTYDTCTTVPYSCNADARSIETLEPFRKPFRRAVPCGLRLRTQPFIRVSVPRRK